MKTPLIATIAFAAGTALSLLVILPLMLADAFEGENTITIVHRVSYAPDGTIKKAQFSYPSWSAYFAAVADESDYTVQTSGLPATSGVSFSIQNMSWASAITKFAPDGYEVIAVSDGVYRVQKKPNQALEPTTTAVTNRADARFAPAAVVAHL
jgi:hypothetical protein